MKILSIHDGHNASAAVIDNGKVVSCVSEERINRKKFFWGWPEKAIAFVSHDSRIPLENIDAVCISHMSATSYANRKLSTGSTFNILKPKIALGNIYNIIQSMQKEAAVKRFQKKHCPNARLFFCDHHTAHAASAYYCSGAKDALVVTCDNLGDSLSHTAYSVKDNAWKLLTSGDSDESLGAFYAAITEGLGFKPNQHEGKIVGLAAYASPDKLAARMRDKCMRNAGPLHFKRAPHKVIVDEVKTMLKEGYTKEEISSAAQFLLEDIMVSHVKTLLRQAPHEDICLAGGVFANVKLNQRIKEIEGVNHIFIQPAMGDEGLVLGSAWKYMFNKGQEIKDNPLKDMYLGTHFSNEEVLSFVSKDKYKIENIPDVSMVAKRVAEGEIVGIFDGRMEFGPRALGARSIVADPRNKEVNNILNERLKRSEFMPFAPSVLSEYAPSIFIDIDAALHAAEFMTITFDVVKEWAAKVPAIVHVDNTARPQFVRKDRNATYWNLIEAFRVQTGIPLVMNTSFNMHEEPIVSSPHDALRSLDVGAVDSILFNGSLLVTKL